MRTLCGRDAQGSTPPAPQHGPASEGGRSTYRRAFRIEEGGQLFERLLVDVAFEVDDLVQRLPISYPTPGVELGLGARIEAKDILAAVHPEHEPYLLLADAEGVTVVADETLGKAIAKPAFGASEQGHMVGIQADLFLELPKHRLFGGFLRFDPALGKLPGILTRASSPKEVTLGIGQYDSDVGPETVRVDQGDFS